MHTKSAKALAMIIITSISMLSPPFLWLKIKDLELYKSMLTKLIALSQLHNITCAAGSNINYDVGINLSRLCGGKSVDEASCQSKALTSNTEQMHAV